MCAEVRRVRGIGVVCTLSQVMVGASTSCRVSVQMITPKSDCKSAYVVSST